MTHSGYIRATLLPENVVAWIAGITMNARFVLAIGLMLMAIPVTGQQSTNHTVTIQVGRSNILSVEMTASNEAGGYGIFPDQNESAVRLTVSWLSDGRGKNSH